MARIALARALYSKRDIVLLDDLLSSLDVRVAQNVFDNLAKICKKFGTTIIITISHCSLISGINRCFVL